MERVPYTDLTNMPKSLDNNYSKGKSSFGIIVHDEQKM
jgi:hypothetical protein